MNISEKIVSLRKRAGWSQEELAFRLDVSRQAVSKWESGAAIPDLDKVLKMSELFSVSTDFMLKEESFGETTSEKEIIKSRTVTREEAEKYVKTNKECAPKLALATMLCIISPILLLLLGALSGREGSGISEGLAFSVGIAGLFVIVACAVGMFIIFGSRLSKYEYLEREKVNLSQDVQKDLISEKEAFEKPFTVAMTVGVVICILSVLPLLITAFLGNELVSVICVCLLLAIASIGVFLFVRFGCIQGAYKRLLEEGEFTYENKKMESKYGAVSGVYWTIALAIYLTWSFVSGQWDKTWLVWPIAGVLFGAVSAILGAVFQQKNK